MTVKISQLVKMSRNTRLRALLAGGAAGAGAAGLGALGLNELGGLEGIQQILAGFDPSRPLQGPLRSAEGPSLSVEGPVDASADGGHSVPTRSRGWIEEGPVGGPLQVVRGRKADDLRYDAPDVAAHGPGWGVSLTPGQGTGDFPFTVDSLAGGVDTPLAERRHRPSSAARSHCIGRGPRGGPTPRGQGLADEVTLGL